MEEILSCYSNEIKGEALSCSAVYYVVQSGCNVDEISEERPIQMQAIYILPYYKHSLSSRLTCSDSVRFEKVLSVSAHGPHS